jgi:hypothetical protein
MSTQTINYCCKLFSAVLGAGTERGLSIVPTRHAKFGDFFILKFRALANEDDVTPPRFDSGEVVLTLRVDQAIKFCPWCGVCLATYYQSIFDQLPYIELSTS